MEEKIAYFKIHPAIGVAHLADNSPNSIEFYDMIEKYQKGENFDIKSTFSDESGTKGIGVQFSVHAYDKDGNWIRKIENGVEKNNYKIEWNIEIANRKLHNYSKKTNSRFYIPEIKGSKDTSDKITGKNPWGNSTPIEMGNFKEGKFTPPISNLYDKKGEYLPESKTIDHYPADHTINPVTKNSLNLSVTDNTSDGIVSAKITYREKTLTAVPAWLVVAPPRKNVLFAPEDGQRIKEKGKNIFPIENTNNNTDFIIKTSQLLGISNRLKYEECDCRNCKKNQKEVKKKNKGDKFDILKTKHFCKNNPNHIDYFMLRTINGDYHPGMEVCLSHNYDRIEENFVPENAFMSRNLLYTQENEIRVQPYDEINKEGTKPGQLTSGLCSTWQGDLMACFNWWTAEYPLIAYKDDKRKEKFLVNHLEDLDSVPEEQKPKESKESDESKKSKENEYLKNNRFITPEEIHKYMHKRSLVYHEYDNDGNVYFIKIPNTGE